MTAELRSYARRMATQYGIDPDLFERQIDQESGFNPGAGSPAGAQGIAQFMPGTAASVGLADPYDPYAALDASARLMAQYQRDYGSVENALIAYNWGPGNVGRTDLPYETQTYLSNITGGAGGSSSGVVNALDPDQLIQELWNQRPDPSDPIYAGADPADPNAPYYEADIQAWRGLLQDTMAYAEYKKEEKAGIFRMEDGQIITRAQMDQLDPGSRAQVESYIANQNIERENSFNNILNELDLTEFTTGQNSAGMENQRRSTDFQNQMEGYREQIGLDMANQNTASKKVDRQLSGMQEASSRAATAMDALLKAAPWGTTNGKSSFSPADLGGAVSSMARFGGIGANDPLVNFTGTQTIDPNAMFNFFDQQMGVSGPLPQIPDLMTQPGQIPQAPGSIPIQQGSPSFARPQAPVPTPMPSATNEIMRNIMAMYSNGAWARR
jgi:hypothetical protein